MRNFFINKFNKEVENKNRKKIFVILQDFVMDFLLKLSVLVVLIIMFFTGYVHMYISFYLLGLYYCIKGVEEYYTKKSFLRYLSTFLLGLIFILIAYNFSPINTHDYLMNF